MIPASAKQQFETDGYALAHGLFSSDEVQSYIDHYMSMHARGGDGWAEGGVHPDHSDPLKRFPRLLQPHRGDEISLRYMTEPRINEWLTSLLGLEPFAVQTMVYYKPAGAKGQALHQDQRYLRVEPGTCIAAWLALDDTDEENGCLQVVPGTQDFPVICPVRADTELSFTGETVPVPEGKQVVNVPMKAGDVLFFNGQLIHGSLPNRSKDRFRRIVVGHYIVGDAERVAEYYIPVYRMDGTIVEFDTSEPGGPCGVFVDGEFVPQGTVEAAVAAH